MIKRLPARIRTHQRSTIMRGNLNRFVLLVLSVCSVTSHGAADELYLNEIKPLLKSKCWACHGTLKQEAGLRLDSGAALLAGGENGPVIVPSDVSQSSLLQRVSATEEFERMPPEGERLTKQQVELFRTWINKGAPVPAEEVAPIAPQDHWAFQPLRSFENHKFKNFTSATTSGDAPQWHPIDFFIERQLQQNGLQLSSRADPVSLIRRLYFILHGLPPTWEQTQEFAASPNSAAFEKLVDELLASPRYGERWGQHWLDIVRYADTHGYEVNTPRPHAWRYRDYIIDAFNSDKPYDQFVREQLSGDFYQQDAATGFLVASAVLLPGQIGKDEPSIRLARQDALDEIIVGTSATFLGLTLGCARCHDHKFDPLTARDYYAMQAFFAGVEYGDRAIQSEESAKRLADALALEPEIERLRQSLQKLEPLAFTGKTIVIDDEDLDRVDILKEKNGHGENPGGTERGYRGDPGGSTWMPNISRGRYTWWDNSPGENVLAYKPQVDGEYDLWISWGAHGSGVHSRDARYVLDQDGDLSTTTDQKELAQIDQYYVAGRTTGETEKKPLWSSLQSLGSHTFNSNSKIIVRGGETGTGLTADVIVLQQATPAQLKPQPQSLTQLTPRPLPPLREPVNHEQNLERFSPILAKKVRFTSFTTSEQNRYEPCLDELEVFSVENPERNIALASLGTSVSSSGNLSNSGRHQLPHLNDGKYGNEKSWISNEKGRGWVELEFPQPVLIDRIHWGRDRLGKLQDRLPVEYQIEVVNELGERSIVATSADRLPFQTPYDANTTRIRNAPHDESLALQKSAEELKKLEQKQKRLQSPDLAYAGTFRDPEPTHLLHRGDPEQPAEVLSPAIPKIFGMLELPGPLTEQQRRLKLASWISNDKNPLTARVMVNRIWHYHFGTGLVETPSDFGLNGSPPSHPELLDWLANEFIQHNWSIKHIQKLIVTSQTWQQSNQIHETAQKLDGNCRLLWRFPMRRLEAEVIRDSILQVSGELNLQMGGPGFDFFKTRGGLNGFPPVTEFNQNSLRRMIYAHKIRMEPVPIFGAFDCPDAGQPTPVRSQSTTAIQALNLFNSPFVAEQSLALAERFPDADFAAEQQVREVYRLTLARPPSPIELPPAVAVVREHGLATLVRVLLNCNEFLMLP